MKKRKIKLSDIGIAAGVLLVAASLAILVFSRVSQKNAVQAAKETVLLLHGLMPDINRAAPDGRANIIMPAVEVGGESFCGIIEIPKYKRELPIRETLEKRYINRYPCRYLGSIYDGSLIIGGSDNEGQFDFVKDIQNDDIVYITDMSGGKYTYRVIGIQRSKDVSARYLASPEADLVIFARNSFSFDYTLIRCKMDLNIN